MTTEEQSGLPLPAVLGDAVDIFLARAYPDGAGEQVSAKFTVPDDGELVRWLIETVGEPEPADADIDSVRSTALRLGNAQYPHMKLRLSRVPRHDVYLFTVDSHDAILQALPGSPDHEAVEALKRHNATLASDIIAAMDAANLPTERNFLREKIRHAKRQNRV